jgi:O-antigen/teichoic acid export membrane protein
MGEIRPAAKVARGASFVLLQTLGTTVIQIVIFAAIARILTDVDLGILSALTFVVGISQIVVNLGLPSAATKFIAGLLGKNDHEGAASVCYQTLKVSIILSSVAGVFCFVFSDSLSLLLLKTTDYSILFKILSFDIIVTGFWGGLYAGVIGLQKFREASIFSLIRLVIRQVLILFALLSGYGLVGLVIAWFIGDLFNAIVYSAVIVRSLGFPKFNFSLKRMLKFSYPLYFSGIATYAYSWFDQALLLAFLPLGELGVYSVALRAFGALTGIATAITTPLFPKYSEMHGSKGLKSVENAIHSASRYICYIVIPLSFGLLALATPALIAFVGEQYTAATMPLGILCFFFAITCIQMAFSGILLVLEKTWLSLGLTVLNMVFGIAFGVLLLPSLGIVGVSIARGLTLLFTFVVYTWVLRRRMNLSVDKEAFWKSLVSSLVMITPLLVIQNIWSNAYLLPVYMGLSAVVYIVMLRILKAVRQSDVDLIKLYLGKRLEFLVKPFEVFLLR